MELTQLIPNLKQPRPQLMTGGQPLPEAWRELARAGVRTVINLRPHAEMADRDESAEVRAAGLTYINVPVDGPATLGASQVDALWQALGAADGPVLVHCGSANRCGALLALAEARHGGKSPADAIAFGRDAGMTALEPVVRQLLGR